METSEPAWPSVWDFGLAPLAQTQAYAAAVRSLTEAVLALDTPSSRLEELIEQIDRTDRELRQQVRVAPAVRVGRSADDETVRPYIDHSIHLGAYNPAFPEYRLTSLDPALATGTVCFSVVYEGPPGLVHGGFLGVFFDVVTGHHNAQLGTTGKTKAMEIRYAKPTPLDVPLTFEINRNVTGSQITSVAELFDGPALLCTARVQNVAGQRANLPRVGERVGG